MRLLGVLLITILLAGCLTPRSENAENGQEEPLSAWEWSVAAANRLARAEIGCASDGSRHILVAGGIVDPPVAAPAAFGVTETVEIYDAMNDSWSDAPSLTVPLHHLAVAHANGRYWTLGGYPAQSFTPTSLFMSWAPGETAWTLLDPLPAPRGAHGVAVVADRIYVVGGVTIGGPTARVDVYDTRSGTWSQLADAPTVREHLAVDAVGQHVYVAGGRNGNFDSQIKALDILDTVNGTWSSGADIPTPRGGSSGAGGAHGFVVAGGEATGKTFAEVELYNATRGAWETLPADPDPRHGLCVAALGDAIHIIAGGHEAGFAISTTHNVLTPERA